MPNQIERADKQDETQKGGGPASQGAGDTKGQQGSPDGGKGGPAVTLLSTILRELLPNPRWICIPPRSHTSC